MPVSFVIVPQWQGSPSPRAMRLAEGAAAIQEDLPAARTREVSVPLEAGDDQGTGVARFSSLQLVRERLADALGDIAAAGDGTAIVVGGDCAVSAAAVAHAAGRSPSAHGGDLALVWFDAHPDLNDAESSPSAAFSGMVLRTLIDDGTVPAGRVVLAGARSWDEGEQAYAVEHGIRDVAVDALADPRTLVDAVVATGAASVYLHVDLDVLDPAELRGLLDPEPFGLAATSLVAAIAAIAERLPIAGATIAAYAPSSADSHIDDAPTLLRVVGALARAAG